MRCRFQIWAMDDTHMLHTCRRHIESSTHANLCECTGATPLGEAVEPSGPSQKASGSMVCRHTRRSSGVGRCTFLIPKMHSFNILDRHSGKAWGGAGNYCIAGDLYYCNTKRLCRLERTCQQGCAVGNGTAADSCETPPLTLLLDRSMHLDLD